MSKKYLACMLLSLGLGACATDGDSLSSSTLAAEGDPQPQAAVCGNGVVEVGEECDIGDTNPGDGCGANCQFEAIALRINKMEVRDPHLYAQALFCGDITTVANALLDQSLTQDKSTPPDGSLDINVLPIFRPLAPTAATTGLTLDVGAKCTVPQATTSCTSTGAQITPTLATNQASGVCLGPVAGTNFTGYSPAITSPSGPCFSSGSATLDVSLGTVTIHLEDARIAGKYAGTPTGITEGLLRGFVSRAQADATRFPADLPLVGGKTLTELLTYKEIDPVDGHVISQSLCKRPDGGHDMDTGPDGVTKGWYFYINYTAAQVPYTPPAPPAPPAPVTE
jgi:cysteine-rich repeat protein